MPDASKTMSSTSPVSSSRHDAFVTIDAAHSRDLDDAIQVHRDPDGWCVEVAVPDLVNAVPKDGVLDTSARDRGWTRYDGRTAGCDIVTGMLPKDLTLASLTLSADHVRSVLRFTIRLDAELTPISVDMTRQNLQMTARLTYEQVDSILDVSHRKAGKTVPQTHHQDHEVADRVSGSLRQAWILAQILLAKRRASGAIVAAASSLLPSSEEGLPILTDGKGARAQIIVQELMILTNAALAAWCVNKDVPILYRNHRPAIAANRTWISEDLDRLSAAGGADEALLIRLTSLLGRAGYGASAGGHWGLNLPFYAHFTSPLRRYADLVNQRQIIAACEGKTPPSNQEDLQSLSEHLNRLIEKDKDDRSEALRLRAHRNAVRALEKGRLTSMDNQAFSRLVKLHHEGALATDLAEEFLAEAIHRLNSQDFSAKDLYRMFFAKNDQPMLHTPIKKALSSLCIRKPHTAATVLEYARQNGLMTTSIDMAYVSPAGFRCALSATLASGATASVRVTAQGKRDAKRQAETNVLLRLAGIEDTTVVAPSTDTSHPPHIERQSGTMSNIPSTRNPKSILNEFTSRRKMDPPVYDHEETQVSTPVHAVKAVVILGCRRIETEPFSSGRKKDAQRLAARAALDQIGGQWLRRAQAGDNPVSVLNEAVQAGQGSVTFHDDTGDPPQVHHRSRCRITISRLDADGKQITNPMISAWHVAATRKEAESLAAADILQQLKSM